MFTASRWYLSNNSWKSQVNRRKPLPLRMGTSMLISSMARSINDCAIRLRRVPIGYLQRNRKDLAKLKCLIRDTIVRDKPKESMRSWSVARFKRCNRSAKNSTRKADLLGNILTSWDPFNPSLRSRSTLLRCSGSEVNSAFNARSASLSCVEERPFLKGIVLAGCIWWMWCKLPPNSKRCVRPLLFMWYLQTIKVRSRTSPKRKMNLPFRKKSICIPEISFCSLHTKPK